MKSVCSACHETFTCLSAFERHRVGSFGEPIYAESRSGKSRRIIGHTPHPRRCLIESEMLAKGMAPNDKGWWMTRPSESHWAEDEEEEVVLSEPIS